MNLVPVSWDRSLNGVMRDMRVVHRTQDQAIELVSVPVDEVRLYHDRQLLRPSSVARILM